MIAFLTNLLLFLWLIRTLKNALFWLYVWQLKEYHIPRFIDHFRTHKGKKIFFNPLYAAKMLVLVLLVAGFSRIALYGLLVMYIIEAGLWMRALPSGQYLAPKQTLKTILLALVSISTFSLVAIGLAVYETSGEYLAKALLMADLLVPAIITLIVLLVQPLFVMGRRSILEKARKKLAGFKKLMVIGITGSYGKTSTKEFLTTILSEKYKVIATKDHRNSEMGIAQTILEDIMPGHEIFIVEMGAYQKGGIKLLCDMVRPQIGVVTGVNEQHLALFGNLENLLSAEGGRELAVALPENGWLAVNGENQHCLNLYKKFTGKKKIYTEHKQILDADIWAEEVEVKKEGISFIVHYFQKELMHISANVLGRQQVQNLLGAILVARELGMTLEQISLACKNIRQEQGGMTLKIGTHGIQIIDSSYSSNPDGVMADLDYLSIFPGKKAIVMPCLIELGPKSAQAHYEIGKKIAQVCDLAIISTRDQFDQIKKGAMDAGMPEKNIIFSENSKEIFHHITVCCKKDDTVLLEGRVPGELIGLLIAGNKKT